MEDILSFMRKATLALSALALAMASAAYATPVVIDYTTGNLGQGTLGNNITKTVNGETVIATAWSVTGGTGGDTTFQDSALGQYSGLGLGVCNQDEISSCTAPQHEVDDSGHLDFVLLTFSVPVTAVSITIVPVCDCDTNASYVVGDFTSSSVNGKTLAQVGTVVTNNETTTDTTRVVTLTGLGAGVTSVLFGASVLGDDNYFKISSVSVVPDPSSPTPEPATFGLAGMALVGLGLIARKRNA
jgi:hypothetical protein